MSEDNARDAQLMQAALAELEQSTEQVNELTRARLKAARLRALAAVTGHKPQPRWPAALAIAAVSAIALGLAYWWPVQPAPESMPVLNGDEWMSTLDDGYELYENLDFYEWLETQSDEERV